ncbi:MAG: LEA type 2 family protein [Oligoflexales bacterium]|nr:LEA type 2 family protein [Oligoflexales bacterium]
MLKQVWLLRGIGLGILLLSVSSCSHFKALVGLGMRKPEVHLSSVKIKHVSFSEVAVAINLKVFNPNEFALDLDRLDYQLSINEALIAKGKHQNSIMIDAGQTAEISLPAEVNLKTSIRIMKELIAGKKDQFMAKWFGTAYFNSSFGPIKIEHTDSKTLS